jgi:GNAT superfamily N-acetyltransferase
VQIFISLKSNICDIRDTGYGIWDMGYGIWDMGYGIWDMGYGIWDMGYGIWDMGYGIWDMGFEIPDAGRWMNYRRLIALRGKIKKPGVPPLESEISKGVWYIKMNKKNDDIIIVEVEKSSKKILESLQKLLPQLTINYKSFDKNNLEEIVRSESTRLFIAADPASGNEVIGSYSLVIFRIPSGNCVRIEDVIVDENRRGQGIGKQLMNHAIAYAKNTGINKIELTSAPSRIEANKLYQTLGFTQIETNVYRLNI